jgi:hypothetical protein
VIAFEPISAGTGRPWGPPKTFGFARDMIWVPISDTELLQAAHFLPLALFQRDDALEVGAVLHPRLTRAAAIDPQGRWRPGYVPIALRAMPFRLGPEEAAPSLYMAASEECAGTYRVHTPDGALTQQAAAVLKLLTRAEEGRLKLAQAAERLFIANLTAEIDTEACGIGPELPGRLLTVAQDRVTACTPERISALVGSDLLIVDLIAALTFSRRSFGKEVRLVAEADEVLAPRADLGDQLHAMPDLPVDLDTSELFSFDMLRPR